MHLVLLAAGKGSRLPKKLRLIPKCMVEINKKSILNHNINFYKKFKYKTIISGYKNNKLKNFIKKNSFKEIINKNFKNTNMVYSLFMLKNIKCNEIVMCYSDIIFDQKIFENLSRISNVSSIILKKNWKKVWKGRMGAKNIKNDAEDVVVKNNKLISIGQKIGNKLPKYQYMGIIKFKLKDFIRLKKFFFKIKKPKIDFTTFLDMSIKEKIINLKAITTNKYWYEIDNKQDLKFTSENIW